MTDYTENKTVQSSVSFDSRMETAMNFGYDNLIGESRQMVQIVESIKKLAPTDINLFIQGEYGVGKEHIAKIIHYHSRRYKNRLAILDCSIWPDGLLNQEFFDFNNPDNILLQTNGGTILIKNIDKMSLPIQKKFENLLTGKLQLDSKNGLDKRIDLRFLATSETELEKLSTDGNFSSLLSQLIGEMKIHIPSLKYRKNDIELLLEYFIVRECITSGKPIMHFTADALDILIQHEWRENVEELKNTIRRAVKISKNNLIDKNSIIIINDKTQEQKNNHEAEIDDIKQSGMLLDEGQRKLIIKTLNKNNWNFTQTARELGIGRTTLWRKVKKYELKEEVCI